MSFHSFATRASNRIERSRQWSQLTRTEQVEIDDEREASMRGLDLGDVRLCMVSMGKHVVAQERARSSYNATPVLKFIFQEEGSAEIRQNSRRIELHAGQWCGMRKDEPFAIESPAYSRQLTVSLPSHHLRDPRSALLPWNEAQSFRRGAAHVLHAAASAALVSAGALEDSDALLLGDNLVQMLEIALRTGKNGASPDVKAERRQAAIDFIERNLADPDLDVATIAAALGCSSRTVHKLFEGESLTVAREIWDRRLERCRMELADAATARRSITEIAHHWGFSDSQHFSRAFKNRFGATPREYRSLTLLG